MKIRYLSGLFRKIVVFGIFFLNYWYTNAQNIQSVGGAVDFNDGNEYDPALSNDGKWLAFVADKGGRFKLYISSNIGENLWSVPEEISEINDFKSDGNIRYPSFNYDASVIYFSADFNKDSSDVDIFYSKFEEGKWSVPISIGQPVNSPFYDGQPSISSDNKALYFVRNNSENQNNTANCKNIVVSYKQANGEWGKPEVLPIPINVDCEANPKIGLDNKTLYFSSTREGGKGGYDIYRTKLLAKDVWIPAESLDTLNTINNDFTPCFSFDNPLPYYAIEIAEKNKVNSKIYKAFVPTQFNVGKSITVKGKVLELGTNAPIKASVIAYDPITSRIISTFETNPQNGEYQIYLPGGKKYQLDISHEGYSHTFINVDAANLEKNSAITQDVLLYKNVKLILNIFDDEIFKPVNALIEIKNSNNELFSAQIEQVKDGRYNISLPIGDEYQFSLTAEYFEPQNFKFDLRGIVQFDEFERDAELKAQKVDFQIDISDEETNSGLPVEVVITNLESNEVIRTTASANSDGKYVIKLREGDSYNVSVSPKGYSYYNTTVDLKKKETSKKLDVKLKQLKEDTKLTLNNITFEVNSSDLKESSFIELNRVVKLMNDNPELKIEISAHTDNSGTDTYNLRLSKRRAASVVSYLVEQKISAERLISQGYGETKPLVANDTDENKALNRRVELKVIKTQ
ncbi:MAG: OmpA family protein [Bacteroidales bacterium]